MAKKKFRRQAVTNRQAVMAMGSLCLACALGIMLDNALVIFAGVVVFVGILMNKPKRG